MRRAPRLSGWCRADTSLAGHRIAWSFGTRPAVAPGCRAALTMLAGAAAFQCRGIQAWGFYRPRVAGWPMVRALASVACWFERLLDCGRRNLRLFVVQCSPFAACGRRRSGSETGSRVPSLAAWASSFEGHLRENVVCHKMGTFLPSGCVSEPPRRNVSLCAGNHEQCVDLFGGSIDI